MPGPVGTVLQTCYMFGVIAPLPTVEGLRADAKIAAGKPGIVTTRPVVIKPFKPLPGTSMGVKLLKSRLKRWRSNSQGEKLLAPLKEQVDVSLEVLKPLNKPVKCFRPGLNTGYLCSF